MFCAISLQRPKVPCARFVRPSSAAWLVAHGSALLALVVELADRIEQFHQRGDRGVERVTPTDIVGHFLDRLVHLPAQRLLRGIQCRRIDHRMIRIGRMRFAAPLTRTAKLWEWCTPTGA